MALSVAPLYFHHTSLSVKHCLIADPLLTTDFRSKFSAIQRAYSPTPRKFYGFCTSVTVRRLIDTLVVNLHIPYVLSTMLISPHDVIGHRYDSRYPCEW